MLHCNRYVINKWCGTDFYFQSDNGIGMRIYNKVPWCEIQGFSSAKYWGEDVKKVELKDNILVVHLYMVNSYSMIQPREEI